VRELDRAELPDLLDPFGAAALDVGNYAPLHLLAHAAEWRVFAMDVQGYHAVNLVLHALCATLLLALLESQGIAPRLAVFAAVFFLLHPANVEAVAWISQLKSVLALALVLGALLEFERRPLLATGLFAAALLTKAIAAVALPIAAGFAWSRGVAPGARRRWAALGGWALLLALFAVPELATSYRTGRAYATPHADLAAHARFIAWVGWRYLKLAVSGLGTSAFHEPGPVGWASPGWLLGLLAGLALIGRTALSLRRRSPEAGFWIGALAGFAPVSQIVPFYFALADRYLYFMLPWALGGAMLLVQERFPTPSARQRRLGFLLSLPLLAAFAILSHQRAALWRSEQLLLADSARHYPDGGTAYFVRAIVATHEGRPHDAVEALRASADRGYHFMRSFDSEPRLARLFERADFQALLREIARRQIAYAEERRFHTPQQLRGIAAAYLVLEDYDRAIEIYEQAIRQGGPLQSVLLDDLQRARERRALARAGSHPG